MVGLLKGGEGGIPYPVHTVSSPLVEDPGAYRFNENRRVKVLDFVQSGGSYQDQIKLHRARQMAHPSAPLKE